MFSSKTDMLSRAKITWESLRKQLTFRDATAVFPAKWRLRNVRRIPFWRRVITQVMGSASDWLKICFYQLETLSRHQYRSMDFPRSFLRCQLAGKPVVTWRNVGCCCCCCFFSVYLMSKIILILNLSMWICVIRLNRREIRGKKSQFGMKQHQLCFRFRQWSNWMPADM